MTTLAKPIMAGRRFSAFLGSGLFFLLCILWFTFGGLTSFSFHHTSSSPVAYGGHYFSATSEQPDYSNHAVSKPEASGEQASTATDCFNAPGANDVYIMMKTGINEIHQKLPQHMLTLFQCVPHYNVFSDVEHTIAGQHVLDALRNVNDTFKDTRPEFEYYRRVNEFYKDGQDPSLYKEKEDDGEKLGWKLDKWKNLPSLRHAYEMHPNMKWYLMIDGDSALIWNNLLLWLQRLDPEEDIYSGAQNSQGITFAHGGSGILISQGAMRKLMNEYDSMIRKWELDTDVSCCGDVEVARQFQDVGVELTASFPMLQGEAPLTVDWNDRHMCAPSVSWHHVAPMEIQTLWDLQMNWTRENGWNTPLLFRDLFVEYVDKHIREKRDHWDNISSEREFTLLDTGNENDSAWRGLSDLERKSVESFDDCRAACLAHDKCLQFKFRKGRCSLGENIRVGKMSQAGDKKDSEVSSGWILDRVKAFKERFQDCEPNWAFNQ